MQIVSASFSPTARYWFQNFPTMCSPGKTRQTMQQQWRCKQSVPFSSTSHSFIAKLQQDHSWYQIITIHRSHLKKTQLIKIFSCLKSGSTHKGVNYSLWGNIPLVEFMYLVFICMQVRVTIGDSGLSCCHCWCLSCANYLLCGLILHKHSRHCFVSDCLKSDFVQEFYFKFPKLKFKLTTSFPDQSTAHDW